MMDKFDGHDHDAFDDEDGYYESKGNKDQEEE